MRLAISWAVSRRYSIYQYMMDIPSYLILYLAENDTLTDSQQLVQVAKYLVFVIFAITIHIKLLDGIDTKLLSF
jgi:hypothetical protein